MATRQDLKDSLGEARQHVSVSTVTRALRRNGLHSRRPRKVPLKTKRHLQQRLKFAKSHLDDSEDDWRKVIWSDETKLELFGHNTTKTVWRRAGEAFKPCNTIPTVKHGGGNIMLWGCFPVRGPGSLVRITATMNAVLYKEILEANLLQSARQLRLCRGFVYQLDNDSKHTAKVIQTVIKNVLLGSSDFCMGVKIWPPKAAMCGGSGAAARRVCVCVHVAKSLEIPFKKWAKWHYFPPSDGCPMTFALHCRFYTL